MSPEVLSGEGSTVASEGFSLGVLLFEAATGTLPFKANNPDDLLRAMRYGPRSDFRALRPDLVDAFAEILTKALDPAPERRYAGMLEMRAGFQQLLERQRAVNTIQENLMMVLTLGNTPAAAAGSLRQASPGRVI